MKIIKNLFFFFLGFLGTSMAESKQVVFNGATSLRDMTLPSIDTSGAFKGKRLIIEKDAHIKGACSLKHCTVALLDVKGSLSINHSKVDQLLVHGTCKAEDLSVAKTCQVHGAVQFKKVCILGKTTIFGACEMNESMLYDLEWSGEKLILRDTNIKNILVKKPSNGKIQKIILEEKTIIDGSIIFEDEKGEVEAGETTEIKGNIIKGSQAPQEKLGDKNKPKTSNWFSAVAAWFTDFWK